MKKSFWKKMTALAMGAVMVASLAACGSKDEGSKNDTTGKSDTTGTAATQGQTETKAETGKKDEVVTVKWVAVGSGMPTNYDAWKEHINPYIEEKIGVNVEFEIVSWGDWDNRRSVIVNTNEDYDILFTNLNTFSSDVSIGAFADITDLLTNSAPALKEFIPEDYWKACSIDNKVYAVPSYKDSSATQYFIWDQELLDRLGLDVSNLKDLPSLKDTLVAIKNDTNSASFVLHKDGLGPQGYDGMGAGLLPLGVRVTDQERKVVSVFEQEDVLAHLNTLHEWYKEGIINADAATLGEAPKYRPCYVAQGWSGAAKTSWGPQMGVEATAYQWGDTILSNDTVQGSMNCISASSKHPDKALQLLELVNTDSYVRDALYYGLEGDDFQYVDGKVEKLKEEWKMAGYTQGTFFNVSLLTTDTFNQWDEVKKLNENAVPSVLLGFVFDRAPVQDELANCTEIYNRYKSELLTGTVEPASTVAAMMKELNSAGFEKIMTEAQAQVDAAFQ